MAAAGIARDLGTNLDLGNLGATGPDAGSGERSGNQWWWQRCTSRPLPLEVPWNGAAGVVSVPNVLLADERADRNLSLSAISGVVVPPRLIPAGTLEMGRVSSSGVGLFTGPIMAAEASVSEKLLASDRI